jgi:hypothetical protein
MAWLIGGFYFAIVAEKLAALLHSPVQGQKYSTQRQISEKSHQPDAEAVLSRLHVGALRRGENSHCVLHFFQESTIQTRPVSER